MSQSSSTGAGDVTRPQRKHGRAGRSATLAEAMASVDDGARVFVSPTCSVPTALVAAMTEARDQWTHIELITDYLIEPLSAFEHPNAPFHLTSLQPSRAVEPMRAAEALSTVPASYSQFYSMLAPGGPHAVDVALLQVSEPGPDGRFSLGVGGGCNIEVLRTAPLVIAEVNPAMPYTFGASEVERDEIDLLVEVEHPLTELAVPEPDEIALAIGRNTASLVEDGAVLQFGIGAIPESVLAALADRTDLGVHGGMVGDTIIDLVEAGALTGARKNVDTGKMVVAAVLGTRRSFDWSHRNDAIVMAPSSYSHGAAALSTVERFVGINSALSIAADGSVNAETAGARVLSGPGGQPDFALGASASPSGLSIIAMPSTAAGGTRSRLVRQLPPGTSTTIPRYLVDVVVTEFGVAHLRGLPLEERPAALASVAHPDFRDELC
ncbi:MAG: acetyl-CoA hydrolase/transferase family protein [Acidimicrobiales bacterium]